MTKSSNSAGCNKRNISATLCLLRPVAERQATHECNDRNSQNLRILRGATSATPTQQRHLLRFFPNLRVRQMGRNMPRNSPPIRGRCGVAPLGAAIGPMKKRLGERSELTKPFDTLKGPDLTTGGCRNE